MDRKDIEEQSFDKLEDGAEVKLFKLANKNGMVAEVSKLLSIENKWFLVVFKFNSFP